MPIKASAYDTYMGQLLDPDTTRNVQHKFRSCYSSIFLSGSDSYKNTPSEKFNPYLANDTDFVYGLGPQDTAFRDVPFFAHPVVIFEKDGDQKINAIGGYDDFAVVSDLRSVVVTDRYGATKIADNNAYQTAKVRAVINHWWLKNGPIGPIRSVPVAVNIFAEVIGETIGASVKMELEDSMRLRIWAAIWYYMNHLPTSLDKLTESERLGLIKFMVINLRYSVEDIERVLDSAVNAYGQVAGSIGDNNKDTLLHWFKLIPDACESIRLESALKDLGVFIGIVSRAHIGQLNGELMAIAFEHPPTWLSLVWSAANGYSNKNSQVSKIAQRPSYRDGITQLATTMRRKLS